MNSSAQRIALACIAGSSLALICACSHSSPSTPANIAVPPTLAQHSAEFKPGVIEVTDGVYVAIGFGIANSILLEGSDGVVIVDTMETLEAAQKVAAEFRKITRKPVKAIIYTHSHPDHVGGAAAFVPVDTNVPIYAQEKVSANMDKVAAELQPVITRRSLRMYGTQLPQGERVNLGIGGFLDFHDDSTVGALRPTRTFRDQLDDTVAGIHFQLVHAPGETDDQLFVWLPERQVLLCGDNFYNAFPNLYTIRGTSYRDPKIWADSLDRMRALHAQFLVPSHTRPLAGVSNVDAALTDYRDAIRFIYDQTIRLMNQGLSADEIAAQLKLPQALAMSPYLQEFYGKAAWSEKAIFSGTLGWYGGDPAELQPLAPLEQARHLVALAGGADAFDQKIEAAAHDRDWQWALQLSSEALELNAEDSRARTVRIAALRALGESESNAPARDAYFTAAHELAGDFRLPAQAVKPVPAMLAAMPLSIFFDGMAVNLHAEDCLDRVIAVGFEFSDTGERYTYIVRHGASELVPGIADGAELQVRTHSQVFKEMLAGLRNPTLTLATGFEMLKGSKLEFARFMALFQPPQ